MINIVATLILVFLDLGKDQRTMQKHNYSMEERQIVTFHADHRCTGNQGTKKIIFNSLPEWQAEASIY